MRLVACDPQMQPKNVEARRGLVQTGTARAVRQFGTHPTRCYRAAGPEHFRRKPGPDLIGAGRRFAAENATDARYGAWSRFRRNGTCPAALVAHISDRERRETNNGDMALPQGPDRKSQAASGNADARLRLRAGPLGGR